MNIYNVYCNIQHSYKGLTEVTRESDTSIASEPIATAFKGYCIPGSSGPHSCPHTLALFNTGLHSLNSKLNPPSGLLGMTDMVNIVESVCQDTGRPALAEQETHSQNIVSRWKMRLGKTVARDGNMRSLFYLYMIEIKSIGLLINIYGAQNFTFKDLNHVSKFWSAFEVAVHFIEIDIWSALVIECNNSVEVLPFTSSLFKRWITLFVTSSVSSLCYSFQAWRMLLSDNGYIHRDYSLHCSHWGFRLGLLLECIQTKNSWKKNSIDSTAP